MRRGEAGFTLPELVVAVAITLILLAAGGYWMLAMRPGALRNAVDDFDSNLAGAKALAASSGNGATLVFAPQPNGLTGFTLRVYSGRPNAANAVSATNTMAVNSGASVSEAHFGSPPFAIFLNSAGYPTGTANYPALDAHENPTFNVIAQQPPCPSGGIVLTFTSAQGVTATRTLPCNTTLDTVGGTDPTPTPNAPHISPTYLLAHDTSDAGPLRFKAAEYGYYHWYASTVNGAPCQTIASDTGAAPATFASPWPYAQPSPASQGGAAPSPPEFAPYTWPIGDPNDPPAWFSLSPVLHNGGMCTVSVADDYSQSGTVTVQVMGDLTASTTSVPAMTVGGGAQTIGFTKTFDSQQLLLSAGGPCLGVVSATTASGSFPSSPSHTPANASVTITPVGAGSCTLIVQDQYGEQIAIGATVKKPDQPFATWPASLVVATGGGAVAMTSSGALAYEGGDYALARVAPAINALFGGGIARAQSSVYTGPCYAQAFASGTSGAVDTSLPSSVAGALGVSVTTDGCILNGAASAPYGGASPTGAIVAYEPIGSGQTGNFSTTNVGACVQLGSWNPPSASGEQASLSATGRTAGSCIVDLSDGVSTQTPKPDAGQVSLSVVNALSFTTVTCTGFVDQEGDRGCSVSCEGTSGGCQSSGQSVIFPCNGLNGVGLFDVTTGEGTDTTGLQINPGQSISVTTSSDGTAFVSASSCASS
ncbi:MAG TPA: type II secretion system protein [Candidatus Baltobacteraceae bacterium]|nr:type II secretion system protein [Candidatus Baltobacteraceae bacterium]